MARVAQSHISDVNIRTAVIVGGAAGNHTLTGAAPGDIILGVVYIHATLTSSSDLTSEFNRKVVTANVINNTGGTASTNGILIVTWIDQDY